MQSITNYKEFQQYTKKNVMYLFSQWGELYCLERFNCCLCVFSNIVFRARCYNTTKMTGIKWKSGKWVYLGKEKDPLVPMIERGILRGEGKQFPYYVQFLEESALKRMRKWTPKITFKDLGYVSKVTFCKTLVHDTNTIKTTITSLKGIVKEIPLDDFDHFKEHFQRKGQQYENACVLLEKYRNLSTYFQKMKSELDPFSYLRNLRGEIAKTEEFLEAQEVSLKHFPRSEKQNVQEKLAHYYQKRVNEIDELIRGLTRECIIDDHPHLIRVCEERLANFKEIEKKLYRLEQFRKKHDIEEIPISDPTCIFSVLEVALPYLREYNPKKNELRDAIQLMQRLDYVNLDFISRYVSSECFRLLERYESNGKSKEYLEKIKPKQYSPHGVIATSGIIEKIEALCAKGKNP